MTEYRLSGDVLRAVVDQEEVLLNTRTGKYHLLNPMGRRVVEHLEQGHPINHLVSTIAEETGRDRNDITADVESFVSALVERALVHALE